MKKQALNEMRNYTRVVFYRDCIRGLGVQKLKEAYDILDNVDGEELEVSL